MEDTGACSFDTQLHKLECQGTVPPNGYAVIDFTVKLETCLPVNRLIQNEVFLFEVDENGAASSEVVDSDTLGIVCYE